MSSRKREEIGGQTIAPSGLLGGIEQALRFRIQEDEASHGRNDRPSDSLWDHLSRVALFAERIGRAEGVEPVACRLAGLFHDAGKFAQGVYHKGEKPEEDRSVEVLRELASGWSGSAELIEDVAESILQLYRDDPEPTQLTKVLFDADNLDKLGPLGIANYFVKAGLRGGGVSRGLLYRLTVEMTYARHAPHALLTDTGKRMATVRSEETTRFLKRLLDSMREDGLYDFQVEEVSTEDGLILDVVAPVACACGGPLERILWEIPGIKCSEIHLKHTCLTCADSHELRFCRPRLLS